VTRRHQELAVCKQLQSDQVNRLRCGGSLPGNGCKFASCRIPQTTERSLSPYTVSCDVGPLIDFIGTLPSEEHVVPCQAKSTWYLAKRRARGTLPSEEHVVPCQEKSKWYLAKRRTRVNLSREERVVPCQAKNTWYLFTVARLFEFWWYFWW
jgi:hypothetical protein